MRRVSGKISLATRRIWGDPEDEDELSAITNSGLRYDGSEFTTSIEKEDQTRSAHNDDVTIKAKLLYSGQALEKDGELPIASKKSNSSLDKNYALLSTDSDAPDEILYNSLTKATLAEQTDHDSKENGDSNFHDSISSVVRPPLSYHDAFQKDSAPSNGTRLTRDHSEAPQDLHNSIDISHQCSKMNIEDKKVSEVMTKAENRFFTSEDSNPQENVTSTNGPYFGEHINDLVFENAVEGSSIIPTAIESKEIMSRNSDPFSNEDKLQLNCDVSELDNDNIPEIVPSKLNKLKRCDERISTNLENEISQVGVLLEIENQLICKSSSESHLQLCSKEIYDGNNTVHVMEPSTFNENCINRDYLSSSVTDLPDSLAIENKQNINEAPDKKTSTNLDLSNEIICLGQALPLRSHSELKNNARDSVSLDEDKSSRCTGITEYTNEEFLKPITSESVLNIAKDASNENTFVGLNANESQLRSQIVGISNEEVDEGYTLITAYNNLYNQVGVNNNKFEDNHDLSRKPSNKYSDYTNTLLTNVQDSKENDNILSLSDDNGKYNYFQSSGSNLPDIVNQHTARVESITHEDKSSEYDNKPNDIRNKDYEDPKSLSEANCTSNEETSPNYDPDIGNSAEVNKVNLLDTNNSNISVKDFTLDIEENEVDLKDSDEAENGAAVETKNMNDEKFDEIKKTIQGIITDTIADANEHTTTDTNAKNTVDTIADRIEDRTEDRNENKTGNNTEENIEEITDRNNDTITDTTAYRIEDRIEEKTVEILEKIEDTTTDTTVDLTADSTAKIIPENTVNTTAEGIEDRTENKTEEKIDEITGRFNDTITDTTVYRVEDCNNNQIEEKTEERILEIIRSIEDRTEGNAKDIVENQVIEKVTAQEKNQAGDDIEANFFVSETSKSENIKDKIPYNTNEVNGDINTHVTDLKIESVVPIDQKFGQDSKKLQLEGAELSESETVKTTRNRKTWLRYVKSFEKRHEEGDSSSIRLSSGREFSGQSDKVRSETIAFTPKIPETPTKKKYTPSHSGSITPDKRRRSFRKKIKEKISDTLHKFKD